MAILAIRALLCGVHIRAPDFWICVLPLFVIRSKLKVVAWGHPLYGGDSSCVDDQLTDVESPAQPVNGLALESVGPEGSEGCRQFQAYEQRALRLLCYTILYYTIPYYTILYHTIPYYTILYHTIPYYTV